MRPRARILVEPIAGFRQPVTGAMMPATICREGSMPSTIQHQPRIAWDAALALVAAVRSDAAFGWCRDRIVAALGSAAAAPLESTRRRLTDPSAAPDEPQVQAGLWRARLEDALRSDPTAGAVLSQVAAWRSAH